MRRPMMDVDGDGIPDGASVTVKWTKGAEGEGRWSGVGGNAGAGGQMTEDRGRRTVAYPIMDENAARPLGAPADEAAFNAGLVDVGRGAAPQMRGTVEDVNRVMDRPRPAFGATNAVQNAAAGAETNRYEGRNQAAATMYGIRQTRPMMDVDAQGQPTAGAPGGNANATRLFLQARMGDASVRPELRAQAGQRLAVMDEMATRESAQGSQERMAESAARGMAGKAEADRDARVAAAQAGADARVEAAGVTANGRMQEAEIRARAAEAKEATRNQMLLDAREERKAAREATTTDKRSRWVNSAMDREYEIGNGVVSKKQTLRGYAVSTRDAQGNLLPGAVTDPVWESRLDAVQEQADGWGLPLFDRAKAGGGAGGTDAARGAATPDQGARPLVKMRAPNGEIKLVPPESVQRYTSKGAVVVE